MLKTVHIENLTVFPRAELRLSPGLNVITGKSGTGKSHLLKLCYTVLKTLESFGSKVPARDVAEHRFASNLMAVFRPEKLGGLVSRRPGSAVCSVSAAWGNDGFLEVSFSARKTEKVNIRSVTYDPAGSSVLFIPTGEIMSVYEGFQGALEKRELAFDGTWLALAEALGPAPLKGKQATETACLAGVLEDMIGASVVRKENRFYFISKSTGCRLGAPLASEGHRRIGMLAFLIRNGELRRKSSLFWDSPEAGLGPELLVQLAQFLAKLSKIMQVTVSAHSLFLLRELEILQQQKKLSEVQYFGLHAAGNGIEVMQGSSCNDIGEIAALTSSLEQSDRYLRLAYEEV